MELRYIIAEFLFKLINIDSGFSRCFWVMLEALYTDRIYQF